MERGGKAANPATGRAELSRSLPFTGPGHQTEGIENRCRAMFLKVRHDDDSSLVEVLNVKQLFNPFDSRVQARLHGGEEMQDPQEYAKAELFFPSGEALPRCWVDSHYQS
jgi:hypothetical protein